MKAAIIVLSDPKNGDDALGRLFNALAAAYDFKQQDDEVTILFHGAGTRWIGELSKSDHLGHELFKMVKDKVAGVSCGCAEAFGTTEEIEKSGFDFIKDNPIPGTPGAASLRNLMSEGYTVLTF